MAEVPIIATKKKRNDFRIESDRLETFEGVFSFDIKKAAKFGLCFHPDEAVACFFCSFVCADWKSGKDPVASHGEKNPDCRIFTGQAFENLPIYTPVNNYHTVKESAYVDYASEELRLRSFRGWNKSKKQTPLQLADAGFFYQGYLDKVTCFQCGMSLTHWKEEDPWTEHAARAGKDCRYVLMVKGEEFVERVIKIKKTTPQEDANHEASIVSQPPRGELAKDAMPDISSYQKLTCSLCNANEKMMCSIPCGHVTTCDKCGVALTKCPTCDEDINGMVKLIFV